MGQQVIPLEKPIADLEKRILLLKQLVKEHGRNLGPEIAQLEKQSQELRSQIFSNLSRYEVTQIARHPNRPRFLDYVEMLFDGFQELHGDRVFGDDHAIVCGPATFEKNSVMLIGQQKGRNTKDHIHRNFGMPNPEGYRKALRMMKMAERFKIPIVTFVDTPGAYPGLGAEQRGQAEAIARNIMEMSGITVPIITFILGEGGSGGALAIAVANHVYMMENAIYSVISPEGCASILMKDAKQASVAAELLKVTAKDAIELGVVEGIIAEPLGGAHRDPAFVAEGLKRTLRDSLRSFRGVVPSELRENRHRRFMRMGEVRLATGEEFAKI